MDLLGTLQTLWETSGFYLAASDWRQIVMILVGCLLLYLGIVKKFEPLLLVGIAFGTLLTNLPGGGLYHPELWDGVIAHTKSYNDVLLEGGLLDILYIGVKAGVYPSLIFMGVGAMTDFGPLLANPKSLLLGAAAQLGVYMAFILAVVLGFTGPQAASIGIIGGADGPTAILTTSILAPALLGYSADSAPHHARSDHQGRAGGQDGAAAHRHQDREDRVPHRGGRLRYPAAALHRSSDRLPDAG